MYIIKEEYMAIKEDLKSIKNMKLPVIKDHEGRKYISIFFLAYELVEKIQVFWIKILFLIV